MPLPQTNINAFTGMNAPTRSDPDNFDARAEDAWNRLKSSESQFNTLVTQTNAMATAANTSATNAAASAALADQDRIDAQQARTDAQTARGQAQGFRNEAEGFKTAAAASAAALRGTSATALTIGVGQKSLTTNAGRQFDAGQTLKFLVAGNGEAWMSGRVATYNSTTGALVVNITAVAAAYAGQGSNTWNIYVSGEQGAKGETGGLTGGNATGAVNLRAAPNIPLSSAPDIWSGNGNFVAMEITSAGINVIDFADAPQVGATRTIMGYGTNTFTLTTSADLIVYGGTQVIQPLDLIDVVCEERVNKFRVTIRRRDGKATVGNRLVVEVITSSQMWTVKTTDFEVEMCGGGQNGQGSSHAGGACAAYAKKQFSGAVVGATASITVGGAGAATVNATRNNGGNSSFVLSGFTTVSCEGGKDTGSVASGGDVNINGVPGDANSVSGVSLSGNEFVAVYRSGAGASCPLGNGAPCGTGAPVNGSGYGAGGAGTHGTTDLGGSYQPTLTGSAGRPGVCIIRYYV